MKFSIYKIILGIIFLLPIVVLGAFGFSKLNPSAPPASTFYSLDDIYNLVAHNTTKGAPNSSISTTTSPTATTSHSTSEIYALLANMVKQENIKTGITILGITGDYGIPDLNYATITTSAISSLIPTSETVTSTGYSLEDIWNLVQTENSATSSSGSHSFPVVSSPSASMHTTSEVYNAINDLISYLNTNKNTFKSSVLGVTGTYPVGDLRVGMVGYWPFNEASGVVASDYSGNGNNGILNGGVSVNQNGKVGKGFEFDGVDDYGVLSLSGFDSAEDFSLFMWVKVISDSQDTAEIIEISDGNCNGNPGSYVRDGELEIINTACNSASYLNAGSIIDLAGEWHQIGYTYSTGYASVYRDGVPLLTNQVVDPDSYYSFETLISPALYIGAARDGTQNFNAVFDEVSIWNRTLSESEVLMLYNNGSGLSLVTNDGGLGSSCSSDSNCDSNNCYVGVCSAALPPLTSGLVGYWPFDEISGTTTNDLSSGNHDGVFSTGVSVNQSGKLGTSFGFDGTGIIDINSSLGLGTVMTVSAWAYLPETTSGSIINIGCADTNWGCTSSGIGIGVGDTTFDDLGNNFFIVNNGIAWDSPVTSIGAGWHYITVVMVNDTIVKQYIDGVYRKNYDASGQGAVNLPFVPLDSGDTIKIGGYDADGYNRLFTGKIDEVAIWNRALSSQEISNLYNGGAGIQVVAH
jgi:hypothetical protein